MSRNERVSCESCTYYIYDEDTKIILMMVADTTEQYLLNQSEKEQIER